MRKKGRPLAVLFLSAQLLKEVVSGQLTEDRTSFLLVTRHFLEGG